MASANPKRILIVEDNLALGAMLLTSLQAEKYEVAGVTGADAALRSLEVDHIDLVILDILLPHMNGLDFLAEMRSKEFSQPVIVVSNVSDAKTRERALELGARFYLVKANTTPALIISLIDEVLAEKSE